jgi:hypothetical protein
LPFELGQLAVSVPLVYIEPEGAAVSVACVGPGGCGGSVGPARALAGGFQLTVTSCPAVTLCTGMPDTVGLTPTAGHAVTYVETDIVGELTLIAVLGVPVMAVLGQVRVPGLLLVRVHALMIWPVLSVTL